MQTPIGPGGRPYEGTLEGMLDPCAWVRCRATQEFDGIVISAERSVVAPGSSEWIWSLE